MSRVVHELHRLPTPCALVELDVLRRNVERMRVRADGLGVRLRPHVKTHKTVEAARLQVGGTSGPVTVSTLAEARLLAAAGFTDICWAVTLAPGKLEPLVDLLEAGIRLRLLVDDAAAVVALDALAALHDLAPEVLLKVDVGARRTGLDPGGDELVALARRIAASPHLCLAGVLSHAGQAYAAGSRAEAAEVAEVERALTVAAAERLRATGLAVSEVSVGSTPTACAVQSLEGVSEIRPGNYVFFDAFQAAIGSCELTDCAFTVLATVIASYPERGRVVLDAGALALSKDEGPRRVDPDCGYGVLLDLGGDPLPGLRLTRLSQEHGVAEATASAAARLPIGSRVRVVPNHSCLAAACFDRYHVLEHGAVVDEWRPARGW